MSAVFHQDKLGLLWRDKGGPAPGYRREKDVEAALQAILTHAGRAASELLGPVAPYLLLAVQPALAVGPVNVVTDPGQQRLDVLAVVGPYARIRRSRRSVSTSTCRHNPRIRSRTAAG